MLRLVLEVVFSLKRLTTNALFEAA